MTMTNDPQAAFIAAHRELQNRIAEQGHCDNRVVDPARRKRSLQTCHRYVLTERPRKPAPRETGAYVPELAARIDNDPNLTDGARRCARKLAELTYRQNREGRTLPVTVTYLARALGRCRRTVQRYLRQLESEGYVAVDVIASQRSRMCVGLVVRLLAPLVAAFCPADGLVLDPFCGSGSTLVAARQAGRDYLGIELDRSYHRIATRRLAA